MASTRLWLPSCLHFPRGALSVTNQVLSSSTWKIGYAFHAEETATINALGIRLGAITGSAPTYQVEIQGLDGSGMPDGVTLSGSNATFNPTSLSWTAGSFNWVSVSGASVTAGNPYAVVISYSSGTIDASNNASFFVTATSMSPEMESNPYSANDIGSGWAHLTGNSMAPAFGYRSSTQTYGTPFQTFQSPLVSTNGNRIALKIPIPASIFGTATVKGFLLHGCSPAAGGTWKGGIWDATGSVLASSATLDSDHTGVATRLQNRVVLTSPYQISAGSTYYFGAERVSGASLSCRTLEVGSSRDFEAYPWGSSACRSDWNGSAWSDTATQMFMVTLQLTDVSYPAGGGVFPGPQRRLFERQRYTPRRTTVVVPSVVTQQVAVPVPRIVRRLMRQLSHIRRPQTVIAGGSTTVNQTVLITSPRYVR